MAFDWMDFARLAHELKNNPDDASLRSAISRVYYAVFHRARTLIKEKRGVEVSADIGSSHKALWSAYRNVGGKTWGAVAVNGGRLHEYRKKADYDQIPNLADTVTASFHAANSAFTYIDQIQTASEKALDGSQGGNT